MPIPLEAALRAGPRRYFLSWWPLRAFVWLWQVSWAGWCMAGMVLGIILPRWVGPLLILSVWTVVQVLLTIVLALIIGWWQRSAVRILGVPRVSSRRVTLPVSPSLPWVLRGWRLTWNYISERATARDVLYSFVMVIHAIGAIISMTIAVVAVVMMALSVISLFPFGNPELRPRIDDTDLVWVSILLGPPLFIICSYVQGWLAVSGVWLVERIMGPTPDQVSSQLEEVLASRRRLSGTFDLERRRIERDLHDGAQQRIVAQAITLGSASMAVGKLGSEGREAKLLIEQAQVENKAILAELRQLVRGIHPQVLRDHGLVAALEEVTARHPIPVELSLVLPTRLPELIESTSYFVLLEALTNSARHSEATKVSVACRLRADRLYLHVEDNGVGGALFAPGGGLVGLADRVSALEGTLTTSSPQGGPTIISVMLPCAPDASWPGPEGMDQ